jgi:outer membrane protein assembly factor BamB
MTGPRVALFLFMLFGVVDATAQGPVVTSPKETLTVNFGFRDWAAAAVAGNVIVAGNSSGGGGLYAVNTRTGKLLWTSRPAGVSHGSPFVATRPAITSRAVIVPMGNTLVAVSIATGKELWRGPKTALQAKAATDGTLAFVLGENNTFYALDAATGREKWTVGFTQGRGACRSEPVVSNGIVYVTGAVETSRASDRGPASTYRHLFAIDAATGKTRWQYPAKPTGRDVCLNESVIDATTYYAVADETLYAIDLATGRERWKLEVRRPVEGQERAVKVFGLVDAGDVLIGVTTGYLIAFNKSTGKTVWEIKGQYREASPSTAVAGRVLYFQGHPGAEPAAEVQNRILYVNGRLVEPVPVLPGGRLNALDLDTRKVLWSFTRATRSPNWSFGSVTPVDGGLWVDSYQALVKLQ